MSACVIEDEMKWLCIKIKMSSDKLLLNISRYRAICRYELASCERELLTCLPVSTLNENENNLVIRNVLTDRNHATRKKQSQSFPIHYNSSICLNYFVVRPRNSSEIDLGIFFEGWQNRIYLSHLYNDQRSASANSRIYSNHKMQ